jgi:peptide/nickel transport system substrate-binding protein
MRDFCAFRQRSSLQEEHHETICASSWLQRSLSVANAQTLRIGLAEDPDILDPTMARTFVGRIVFAGLCDKLFDLDEKLNIVPQLATFL